MLAPPPRSTFSKNSKESIRRIIEFNKEIYMGGASKWFTSHRFDNEK